MDGFYDNTGYVNKRNRKQVLILDVSDEGGKTFLGAGTEFSVDLFEPLIIDSLSEVYLDNFISFNSNISNDDDNSAFVLKINEFNMNSNVASASGTTRNALFNSLLIPNEHSSTSNNQSMVIQKAKKFNYVCDINPGKISNITGTITNLAGGPMFHGSGTSYKYTYALTGIVSSNFTTLTGFPIANGTTFTMLASDTDLLNVDNSQNCIFLATHFTTSTTLHFATDTELSALNSKIPSNLTFTMTGGATTPIFLDHAPATNNPNLTLITNPGRFIAEFSINSRE
jgi:hypothetical protein